jgi:branched-chain amino acid transport system substrate-binding protein
MQLKRISALAMAGALAAVFAVAACAPAAAPSPSAAPAKPAATTAPPAVAGATSAPAPAAPTSAAAPSGSTIKIGFGGPLTGDQGYLGQTWMNGVQLAINESNAAGGVLGSKLELVPLDDQADPKQGTVVAQRFADDTSIMAVVAHFNSGVTIPAEPIYNKARLLEVTNSSNPQITTFGFDNLLRPIANDFMQGGLPAQYAIQTLGGKKAAAINDKQAFGQGVSDVFQSKFKELGGTITSVNGVNATDTDFSAVVTKIKNENPDVVHFGGLHVAGGLILKQMRAQGMKQQFFGADPLYEPDFPKVAGLDNATGAIVSFQVPPYDSSDQLKAFAANYKKTFNDNPGPYSGNGYIEGQIVVNAIKAAGKADREAIVQAGHSVNFTSLYGPVAFDKTGELTQPAIFLYQVDSQGNFNLLYPKS